MLDALTLLGEKMPRAGWDATASSFAEAVVPGRIEEYLAATALVTRIDDAIYRSVARSAVPPAAPAPRGETLLHSVALAMAAGASRDDVSTRDQILAQISTARRRLYEPGIDLRRAFTRYLNSRRLLTVKDFDVTPAEQLDIEVTGQLLAIAVGELNDALTFSANADALLSRGDADALPAALRADAKLAGALTQFHTSDTRAGITHLRSALALDEALLAKTELYTEVAGLVALMLQFFGGTGTGRDALGHVEEAIAGHDVARSGRAAADIARLFSVASCPGATPARVQALVATAEAHSSGTAYASYLHYVSILGSMIDRDLARGMKAYEKIRAERRWALHNPGFQQMASILNAVLLAAQGQVSAARGELAEVQPGQPGLDGADTVLYHLATCRFDLIANRFDEVLEDTSSYGPLDEQLLHRLHLRRYLPAMLIIRGTAIAGTGSAADAHDLFRRALAETASQQEFFAVGAAETPEFRAWLESLQPDELSDGPSRDVRSVLLSRPILIGHGLPLLTAQQTRILRYLALGWSTSTIGDALHVSNNTIKTHLRRLYERLGVNSREQAVRAAVSYGLVH